MNRERMQQALGRARGRVARTVRAVRTRLTRTAPQAHVAGEPLRPFFFSFRTQDQILFAKRLAMILRSGMPIMEGLHMLGDEAHSSSSIFLYRTIIADVSGGRTLSSGLRRFEHIFGPFCINIVRVGEVSGTLHQNLDYLAEELKRRQALRRKVAGALVYPGLIVLSTVGITVLLTGYIFPKIIPIFISVKASLPLSTRILMILSDFLTHWWALLLGGIVGTVLAFVLLMRLPRFRLAVDTGILRIPLLGSLSRYYNLANICRTLSLLLRSDIRIVESVELVAGATGNRAYRRELERAGERLMNGQKISQQFRHQPLLFPSIMVQMIAVGESTGNLPGTLSYLSDMYEEEIGELTKSLTNLLEPILMIVMGIIVGFIAISIITPIYSITQSLTPH